jgi:energy-coupling factor transport system substrate-specific component
VSGALLGGLLGHLIVKALYRTGVLSGLAIECDLRTANA